MQLVYHRKVKTFIKGLQKPTQAKVLRSIELIEQYGQNLGLPQVKKITTILYELRVRGQQEVRLFFIRQEDKAILIHGFVKKKQKTPKREIETATARFQIIVQDLPKPSRHYLRCAYALPWCGGTKIACI